MKIEETILRDTSSGVTLDALRLDNNSHDNLIKNNTSVILHNPYARWDLNQFNVTRDPIVIGKFTTGLYNQYPRVLDLPIKFPHTRYRLPTEFCPLTEMIQHIINCEHYFNTYVGQYYCYLTVDQGWVEPGTTQRRPGCHVDGFQGARINPKQRINHSYVVSNCLPTVYYPHAFKTDHLREDRDNFFLDFDRQAQEDRAWRPQPKQIVLTDAYCVHRADVAQKRMFRTFVRVSYDTRMFDRAGNTHNPMFNYSWDMVTRDIQSTLK